MSFAFNFREASNETLEIDVFEVIGGWFGVNAADIRRRLNARADAKLIKVAINSRGGDVFEGLSIYEQLVNHSARVQVHISALAASMGSVIAMAGDEITIAESGFVMVHGVKGFAAGDSDMLRDIAKMMDAAESTIANIYAKRTGQPLNKIEGWLSRDTYMTAAEALERGFVTSIAPAKTPAQQTATAKAFAMFNAASLDGAPPALLELVRVSASATPTDPPAPSGTDPKTPTTGEEKPNMSGNAAVFNLVALCTILGMSVDADEKSVLNKATELKNRSDALNKIEGLTGKTGEEAFGLVKGYKENSEKLVAVEAELTTLKASSEKTELDAFIEGSRSGAAFEDKKPRLTKAEADKLREQVEKKELSLAAARAFVSVKSPVAHLSADPPSSKTPELGALALADKKYEELTNMERQQLCAADEDAFNKVRKDWEKRGRPEKEEPKKA